jgi:RHS repeat-associated protein
MNCKYCCSILTAVFALVFSYTVDAQNLAFTQKDIIKTSGITSDSQIAGLPAGTLTTSRLYEDGLFRPIQNVFLQGSPNSGNDIIVPVVYNKLGVQTVKYLPFVDNTATYASGSYRPNAIALQSSYYSTNTSSGNKVASDASSPYSQMAMEDNPLLRPIKAGDVGSGHQPVTGQKYKTVNYRSNNATDAVIKWGTDGSYNSSSPYYTANQLRVTEVTAEDSEKTITFEDNNNQLILKRRVITSPTASNLDTYYIYNNGGSVSYVLPPKAIALMVVNSNYSLTQWGVNKLIFVYVYDSMGRLVERTQPGAAPGYIIYDPLNRPVLFQDGDLRVGNQWKYNKYDAKGRVVANGIYTDNVHTTRTGITTGMQDYVSSQTTAYNTNWYESRAATAATGYYTNNVFPKTNQDGSALSDLAYAYFDDYFLTQGASADFSYTSAGLSGEAGQTTLTRGLPTMVRKRTVGSGLSNIWLINVMFYDKRGNIIQVKSNNQLNYTDGKTVTDTKTVVPDFTGKPMFSKVVKVTGGSATTSVISAMTYNQNSQVTAISQSYDNGTTFKGISSYSYNELGQLVIRKLGKIGTTANYLQNVDYRYNIRGQLLSINNSKLSNDGGVTNTDTNDLFGLQLLYDQADANLSNTAYYDGGKLSAVKWMSKDGSGTSTYERAYKYGYDGIGRYNNSYYAERTTAGTGAFNNNVDGFNESVNYDAGGNITVLSRNSSTQGTNTHIQIDFLTYTYDPSNPNQVYSITDGSGANYTGAGFRNLTGATAYGYSYDSNGNLTIDPYKGMILSYNVLNRTDKIVMTLGTNRWIDYTYDAAGSLLRKRQYDNNVLQNTTDYIDGFMYVNTALSYFPMPEGRVLNLSGTLKQEFVITDHQGNARVSFQDNGSGVGVVKQENSYYAFGLVMPNSPVATPTTPNKQLYNGGSEWQNDYGDLPNYYQTFYRNYDAATGRFIGVDPMAVSAASMTPYQYANNNPVMNNDPLGDMSTNWIMFLFELAPGEGQTNIYFSSKYTVQKNESGSSSFGGVGPGGMGSTGVGEFFGRRVGENVSGAQYFIVKVGSNRPIYVRGAVDKNGNLVPGYAPEVVGDSGHYLYVGSDANQGGIEGTPFIGGFYNSNKIGRSYDGNVAGMGFIANVTSMSNDGEVNRQRIPVTMKEASFHITAFPTDNKSTISIIFQLAYNASLVQLQTYIMDGLEPNVIITEYDLMKDFRNIMNTNLNLVRPGSGFNYSYLKGGAQSYAWYFP